MTPNAPEQSTAVPPIALVVLDMAGTTVLDDGVVEEAFARAAQRTGLLTTRTEEEALNYVRATMGRSKIDVFTHLADGDRAAAEKATAAFEEAYQEIAEERGVEEIPGAGAAIAQLAAAGRTIALTTGFSPRTRDAILDRLPWADSVAVALSPIDAGRGRPAPDLVLTALIRTGSYGVDRVVVVGDTTSDVESGRRAGAGLVVGVASGAHDRASLTAAGADAVLDDVTQLPALLEALGR